MQVTISGAFFFSSMFPEANGKNSGLKNEEDQHNMASILSHLVSNKMSILALNYTFWGQSRNLGSSGNGAVFIEAGSFNKRGEIGDD